MKIRFFILSLLLVSLLTACITASQTIQAISHYSLIYQAQQKNKTSISPIFDYVKVDRPSFSSQHSTEGIIYSNSPYQLDVYSLNVWQKPLTILFQDWLLQSLEDSQLFTGIMRVTSRSKVSLFLESDIVKFQHNVKQNNVEVDIRLTLLDYNSRNIIKHQRFYYQQKTSSNNAKGAVDTFNQILKIFAQDMFAWLKEPT